MIATSVTFERELVKRFSGHGVCSMLTIHLLTQACHFEQILFFNHMRRKLTQIIGRFVSGSIWRSWHNVADAYLLTQVCFFFSSLELAFTYPLHICVPVHSFFPYFGSIFDPPASSCAHRFQESYEDPHKPLPSPVVHIRGLVDGIMEADLVEALQEFGAIR